MTSGRILTDKENKISPFGFWIHDGSARPYRSTKFWLTNNHKKECQICTTYLISKWSMLIRVLVWNYMVFLNFSIIKYFVIHVSASIAPHFKNRAYFKLLLPHIVANVKCIFKTKVIYETHKQCSSSGNVRNVELTIDYWTCWELVLYWNNRGFKNLIKILIQRKYR